MPTLVKRGITGLIQGAILAILYFTGQTPTQWPATEPAILLPMMMVALFIPLLITQSIGNMRTKTLLIWVTSATVILAGIAYYAVFRDPTSSSNLSHYKEIPFLTFIALFIAHSLILSADHDRRLIALYPRYFDMAWKLGIQAAFTAAFTGCFWMLLLLGAGLFHIIHLDFFEKIISNFWFAIPATTLVVATALHITDTKVNFTQGIRTLSLVLLSWLLPLITSIIAVFLLSLFFTGPSLLWQTGHASILLLISAVALIILINSAYQDGASPIPLIQRYTAILACCLLTPLIALAIYALSLRVQQYGWSVSRISAAAFMLIIAAYSCGYLCSIFISKNRLKFIETCNIAVAFFMLAIYLAVLTPIADPARLTVANQLSRLQTGKVTAGKFDFKSLRLEGLRYGEKALKDLQTTWSGPQTDYVRTQAKTVLALDMSDSYEKKPVTAEARSQLIIIHTKNTKLPDSFLKQNWSWLEGSMTVPGCLNNKSEICHAWIIQDHSKPLIILLNGWYLTGFQQNAKGIWALIGSWNTPSACKEKMQDAIQGKFKMVKPQPKQFDIEIAGWRTSFTPNENTDTCN